MYQKMEITGSSTMPGIGQPHSLFNEIIACGPGAVVVLDGQTFRLIFANDQFEHMLGYDNDAIRDADFSFLSLIDDFDINRLKTHFNAVLTHKEDRAKYVVYKLKNRNGEYMHTYLYATPVSETDDAYKNYFHLLILPNISKWDLPFTSFDTGEIFFEQFAKEDFGTFEWIVEADKAFWSDGVYKIHELDKAAKNIDRGFVRKYIHPEDKDWVYELFQQAMESGSDIDVEYRIITERQNIKVVHALGRLTKGKDGEIVKLTGSIRDVTDQRKSEQELNSNVEELNRSNRELEEFAYVASHDMQEPLRKITTFSDRLAERYKDELKGDGAMYLERMMSSAENMRQLINNLLEFSRITKSTQPFTSVNLNFIVHQVKTDLELSIEETGTTINSVSLPTIAASMTQMKQLFTNIINNAIKFRKQDVPPVIDITSQVLTNDEIVQQGLLQGTSYHKIQITDNGIGFESEYATRIFQIFQRLHGKSEYPGSGIGLAICKKIMEHHHGTIYAEGIQAQGSRFTFILPEEQIENEKQ